MSWVIAELERLLLYYLGRLGAWAVSELVLWVFSWAEDA